MLASRYEIKQELGKGGMGVVYRGYDTLLKREVAVKFISNSELGTEGRARLLAEAQAVAQLNHPNIVTIFDAVDDISPFIVMEIVEGKTLRQTPINDIAQALEIARQICLALEHAHHKSVIHRDLKPENVIVLSDGAIKLMDFGLARTPNAAHITETGAFVGTISYVAPELLQGKEPSPQSDLYAFGIILFEMLTGQYPFQKSDLYQIISQHLHAPVPSPNKLRENIPDALNALVLQLLEKQPENRPTSASKVGELIVSLQVQQNRITIPPFSSSGNVQSMLELANKHKQIPNEQDKEWHKKGYVKSSLPVLDTLERKLILSNQAKELKRGIDHLENHRLLIITGMPGIGKSTLARAMLEFMPTNSPPPFWYDFERQRSSGNSLGVLLDRISSYLESCLGGDVRQEVMSFRQTPGGSASIHEVDLLIDYLNQEMPIWLVFDNLETVLSRGSNSFDDPDLELLFDGLKSNAHNAKIIITNPFIPILHDGKYLLEFGTQPLNLNGLDEKSATEYLRVNGLQDFSEETLTALARTASGHPFTLNHIAHYVQSMGVNQELDTLLAGLEEITIHFKSSLEHRLSPEEFGALQALSVLNREISLDGLRLTANTTPTIIKRLRDEGLLQTNDTGKFWLHNIVRTSLRATDIIAEKQAHRRASSFYQSQKLPINRNNIDSYSDVLEWHHHAIEAREPHSSFEALYTTGLEQQLIKWNEYHLLTDLCGKTLEAFEQNDTQATDAEKTKLFQTLGIVVFYLGEYEKSIEYLQKAMLIATPQGEPKTIIELLIDTADAYNRLRDFNSAMTNCQEALRLLPDTTDEILKAKALHLRGTINRDQGNLTEATSDLESALKIYEAQNAYTDIAHTNGDLGFVYYNKNQFDDAVSMYQRVVEACTEIHDMRGIMIAHYNIGEIMLLSCRFDQALTNLETAFTIARKKKISWMELEFGLYLTESLIETFQLDAAEALLRSLASILMSKPTDCLLGRQSILQSILLWKRNQPDQAIDSFKKALEYLENKDCEFERARAYISYAKLLKEQKNLGKAEEVLQKALEIFIRVNNQLCIQAVNAELAGLQGMSSKPNLPLRSKSNLQW